MHERFQEKQKVKVKILERDWQRLLAYCRYAAPNEVGGLAHAEIVNGSVVVSDPFILKQEVSGSNFEMDRKDLVGFISTYERIANVKCVWHSHVQMSAFFSSCDRETSNTLAMLGQMMRGESSWFVSLVLNVKGEYEAKIDMYSPLRCTLEAEVVSLVSKDDEIEKQVKDMCKTRSYHYSSSSEGFQQGELHGVGGSENKPPTGGLIIVGGNGDRKTQPEKTQTPSEPYSEDDVFAHLGD